MKFAIFSLCLCVLSISLYAAQNEIKDNATGETFPREVSFTQDGKEYELEATGVATRKKFFVKVYSVAHYLQSGAGKGADIIQTIMQDDNAKQLTLKWVRSVGADKVTSGYEESFQSSLSGPEYAKLKSYIDKYISFFNRDVQKGDEHVLRWLPGGDIEVIINGNPIGSIKNVDFAKGLWNIWFGSKSVVDRNNLISLMK